MTRELTKQLLDDLERRFQQLRDRAGAWPEACRQELEAELQGFSQDLAALRQAGPVPEPPDQGGPGVQEASRRCDAILRHYFSAIPDVLAVIDSDFNIVMSNLNGPEFVPKEAQQGQLKCYQVFHRRDCPCDDCHLREIFATGQPQKVKKLSDIDGRPLEVSAFPILNESGRVNMVAEHVRDITERYQAQEALREGEALYRSLFENMLNGLAYCKMLFDQNQPQDFIYLEVNNSFEVLTGLKNVIGKKASAVIPGIKESNPELFEIYGRVALTGKPERFETYVEALQMWFSISVYSPAPEYFVAVFDVITDRKQAEAALGAHLKFLQLLLDTIPNPIFFKDAQGGYLGCNTAFEDLFGITREEIVGKTVYDIFPPELADEYRRKDLAVFQTTGTQVYETVVQTREGARRNAVFHKATFSDPEGRVGGLVGVIMDITGLKQAEEALRQSEERFRAIFEHAQVGISMTDLEGRYLQANQALQQFLGYTAEELMSLTFKEVTHPEDLPSYGRLRDTLVRGQFQHYSLEKRYVRKDGEIVWAQLMVALLKDAQGNPQNLISTYVDITAHKQAEEALRESEERFRAIFESAPVGISMTDLEGRVLQSNRVLQALLGYTAEELRGKDSVEIIHPEDRPENARLGKEVLTGNQRHYFMNNRLLRKNGEIVWGHVTVTLLRDVRGEPEYFVGTVLDITAQKQAEEELRKSEKRFRLLAETIQDVFWITTPDMWQVTYLSPGYVQVWGRPRERLYQEPRSFRESIYPEDRERVLAEMARGRELEIPWSQEYRIIKPGGEVRWIQDRGFPVRDDHSHVIMFTGVATDITERKALEQQLLQAQKMEVAGRLAGGVAHDFNNLIMAIMGYAELMGAKILKGNPLYSYLEEIRKATDRAAGLTQQLLTFSRQQIMKPQVIDLNRVLLDLKQMLERVLGEDVDLEIMVDSGTAPVKADAGQLTQILMNLVVNARDAMPRGGRITIETAKIDFEESRHTRFALASPGPYVRLTVRDTGLGMNEETRAHIFEPFFTTKEPGKGTGLGLSTVYGIVKQSQGYIDLKSEPGRGSAFTIYLPRLETAVHAPESAGPITKRLRGTETILLVEDEDVLRTLLGKFLRLCGYTVLEARHGGEALLLCERHQGTIHLMVTDVVMPQMSGRELADRLLPLHPGMKVLFMSGYTEDAVVHHGVAHLSMPFLQKPFKPIQLVQKIQAILNLPAESFVSE